MKGISISEVLMYIIAVVIIVGLTFYFAFFLNVTASTGMASESYLLFLNSLYLNRINYCTYLATKDSNYLFYMFRDMDISSINGLSDYIKNCFSKVETKVNLLEGNYSVNSDNDLDRLSKDICGYDDSSFKSSIRNEYKDCLILIYKNVKMSTVPIFAYIDIRSNKVGWIIEPAKALFEQEEASKDWWTKIWETAVNVITFGIYGLVKEYYENQLINSLENNAKSFVSCDADKSYSIVPSFALQSLVVDTNRNLYVLSVLQFSKSEKEGESAVIVNLTNKSTNTTDINKLKAYCISDRDIHWS